MLERLLLLAALMAPLSMLTSCQGSDSGLDSDQNEGFVDDGNPLVFPNWEKANGEHRAVVMGETLAGDSVELPYKVIDGVAFTNGDIALGEVNDQGELKDNQTVVAVRDGAAKGNGITGRSYLWPEGVVAYAIDPAMPDPGRATQAMAHWRAKTGFRFKERTTERDYVYFFHGDGCWSMVGRQGGMQKISLGTGCTVGPAIHEIGHAIGLWHEHNRNDRDPYVTVHPENIADGYADQFAVSGAAGKLLGGYDIDSIMHYGSSYFSKNGQPTLTKRDGSLIYPNRNGLSSGDLKAVAELYRGILQPEPGPGPGSGDANTHLERVLQAVNPKLAGCQLRLSGRISPVDADQSFTFYINAHYDDGTKDEPVLFHTELTNTIEKELADVMRLVPATVFKKCSHRDSVVEPAVADYRVVAEIGQTDGSYRAFKLKVTGAAAALARIAKVKYHVHESFKDGEYATVADAAGGFATTWYWTYAKGWTTGGATIYLKSGQTIELGGTLIDWAD